MCILSDLDFFCPKGYRKESAHGATRSTVICSTEHCGRIEITFMNHICSVFKEALNLKTITTIKTLLVQVCAR